MIIAVKDCKSCPFMQLADPALCKVSTPKNRPLDPALDRPTWCPLRREQMIVREVT